MRRHAEENQYKQSRRKQAVSGVRQMFQWSNPLCCGESSRINLNLGISIVVNRKGVDQKDY